MKTSILRPLLLTITAGAILVGCASSRNGELLRSFEDISAGFTKNGFKLSQVRTMSINGQLPFVDIGALYYYKPVRGNLAAVGLHLDGDSTNLFRNSHELIQCYESDATTKDLTDLRDQVLVIARLAGEMAAAEAEHRDASRATNRVELLPKAEQAARTARTKLQTGVEDAIKQLKQKNVVIFRWQADSKADLKLVGGDVASAKFRREMGRSGYVIIGGMRSRTLFLSEADGKRLEARDNATFPLGFDTLLTDWWPTVYGSGIYVVTHLLEAGQIAYVSEESLLRALDIHAQYSKGTQLKDIDKVSLDLAISSVSSLANAGVIACTGTHRHQIEIGGPPSAGIADPGSCCGRDWTPIMGVTTRLRDFDELFKH